MSGSKCPYSVYRLEDGNFINCSTEHHKNKKIVDKKGEALNPDKLANRFLLKTYTLILERNQNFKRRITYVLIAPPAFEKLKTLAYVEYGGIDLDEGSCITKHKNARKTNKPYIAQKEGPVENAWKDITNGMKLIKAYNKNFNPLDPPNSIRNYSSMVYLKCKYKKQELGITGNISNDLTKIFKRALNPDLEKHPFIGRMFTNGKPLPSLLCYEEYQMTMVPNVCTLDTFGAVFGKDITFNLVSKTALFSTY